MKSGHEYDEDESSDLDGSKSQHIKLKARNVTPVASQGRSDGQNIIIRSSRDEYPDTRLGDDEEFGPWMAEMTDQNNWIEPQPPARQVSTCELTKIQLEKVQSARKTERSLVPEPNKNTFHRAQLIFILDDNRTTPITYKLHTNPVFVTPPPCYPGSGDAHQAHLRELHRYQESNVWTIEQLKDHTAEDDPEGGGVLIINATGQGAETLARAWCSERGKNAVIRRANRPCFICAERAARDSGLGTGVLIWVS